MPDTIVPISALDTVGLNKDSPPVALSPSAFTDAKNVRFRHGSVSKLNGEKSVEWLTPTHLGHSDGEFIFITEWTNPNLKDTNTYYIVVVRDGDPAIDYLFIVKALPDDLDNPEFTEIGSTTSTNSAAIWQSTTFQGGFAIILNNGVDIPQYLLDVEGGIDFADFELKDLPNWDSYYSAETLIDITRDIKETGDPLTGPELSLGQLVDLSTHKLLIQTFQTDGTLQSEIEVTQDSYDANYNPTSETAIFYYSGQEALYVVLDDEATNTTLCYPAYNTDDSGSAIEDGERFVVYKQSLDIINIRASLIKAYRDILIAGDLRIIDTSNGNTIRRLPGLIRTSNIAAPGSLPTNWNPFSSGANTADEIQLSSTGIVRDMVPLQNQMIIYTDRSIHSLTITNNPLVPFSINKITDQYGAMTLDSVIEFDGRHLVVGNNDIYIFGGHPGSIQSVAENKVRDYFYRDINVEHLDKLFIFRNTSKNEIWINYPSGVNTYASKTLIWNYKLNVFTIREMSKMRSGFAGRVAIYNIVDGGDSDTGPTNTETPIDEFVTTADGGDIDDIKTGNIIGDDADPFEFDAARRYPVYCDSMHVYYGEADDIYTLHEGGTYESRVARIEMPITPEFNTEYFNSLALWTTRKTTDNINLYVFAQTHNVPTGDEVGFNMSKKKTFVIGDDYKVDIRSAGRFFDYVITDKPTSADTGSAEYWAISGMQARIGKAGER